MDTIYDLLVCNMGAEKNGFIQKKINKKKIK